MNTKYSETDICAAQEFVRQYGYDWKKETDPNYLDCANQIQPKIDKRVFYYTTVGTFNKFAENGCLWASHIRRMNDWMEFELGRDQVLRILKDSIAKTSNPVSDETRTRIEEAIHEAEERMRPSGDLPPFGYGREYADYWHPEVYNISFTTAEDLLSQWKMYARESGVAVEFDFSQASTFWQKSVNANTDGMDFKQEHRFPRRIDYQIKQLEGQLTRSIQLMDTDPDQFSWQMVCILEQIPFFKHPGFSQEGESRLIFRPYKRWEPDNTITHSKIGYREAGHILVPYLEIYCGEPISGANLADCIGWPVVSLTVGPGHDQDVVFESLIHRLEYGKARFRPFTDKEKFYAQKKLYQDFAKLCPELSNSLQEKLKPLRYRKEDGTDRFQPIKELLHNDLELGRKYDVYCSKHHLCNSGILIKKSQIPYTFS